MKNHKFILIYDCPFKDCDKLWLYNGLSKYGNVKVIDIFPKTTYLKLSMWCPKIKLGKIILRSVALFQSLRAIACSDKDDVIIVWNYFGGIFIHQILNILRIRRKVVGFCWIDLPKKKNYKKVEKCLNDEYFIPIINDKRLKEELINLFKLKSWHGFMLPDVFDDSDNFMAPKYIQNEDERYCFAGGLNNRDWNILIDVSKKLSNVKFVVVSDKGAIKKERVPKNMITYEKIDRLHYYKLMKKAYLTICPLIEDRVSGLINIIKSIQYGIPCVTTKFDVTSSYYPSSSYNELLYEKGNCLDLLEKINNVLSLSENEYYKLVASLQGNLTKKFNPEDNVKKLYRELKKRGWL